MKCFMLLLFLCPGDGKENSSSHFSHFYDLQCLVCSDQCLKLLSPVCFFRRYLTGALTPLVRWLSQGMQRAAAPPQPPRPAARAENIPPAARQGDGNAAHAGICL